MSEVFTNFWFLLFGMITITTAVAAISGAWKRVQKTKIDADLKRDMLHRGMSCEEIERVLAASARPLSPPDETRSTGVDVASLEEVVALLAEHGASPGIVEQVLTAFRSVDAPTQYLVSRAVQSFCGGAADAVDGEQILAVVRPLCLPKEGVEDRIAPILDTRFMQEAK